LQYPGTLSGSPETSVVSSTDSQGATIWEGDQQSVTFPDGNVFTWYIPGSVPVGTYAGTANANQGSFYCYDEWNEFSYTTAAGSTCTVVYDCNHKPPETTVSADFTQIYYNLDANYVTLPPAFTTSPHDIFNNVFSQFDNKAGMTVNDATIDLGNDVSIVFSGNGDIAGTTLMGLSTILVDVVSQQSGLTKSWTEIQDTGNCLAYCEARPTICCKLETVTVGYWEMAESVTVYAENSATKSDQGQLCKSPFSYSSQSLESSFPTFREREGFENLFEDVQLTELPAYVITYTPPAQDCSLLNILASALGEASLIPDVGPILGALGSGLGIVESLGGC
jgi:hypothetical protein